MNNNNDSECVLRFDHLLVCFNPITDLDLEFLTTNFAGKVVHVTNNHNEINKLFELNQIENGSSLMFFAGDATFVDTENVLIIRELSINIENKPNKSVTLGQVPINVCGLGILFRDYFGEEKDNIFDSINEEHVFQTLTESNKQNNAFRTGLYITDVVKSDNCNQFYRLLRCSTNFAGPTESLGNTDRMIIDELNKICQRVFKNNPAPATLNHVLAQIYHNSRENKARIKRHSDKTKDMPKNGLIAFCTFYKLNNHHQLKKTKMFDVYYKQTSALSCLKFRSKNKLLNDEHHEFTVKLYPNSVFLIPLSTNRLYTHSICPSSLPFNYLPTRMGYVVRCSQTKAKCMDSKVFVKSRKDRMYYPLETPTEKDVEDLKMNYYLENTTDQFVDYGDVFFSLNSGDYIRPICIDKD